MYEILELDMLIYIGQYGDVALLQMYRISKIPLIYIAVFAHKSVMLVLCIECSETQVATLSLTLFG